MNDLINKVGGIEKAQDIVRSAPDGATGLIDDCYIKNASNKGDYTYAEVFQNEYVGWKRNARAKTSYFIENVIDLNDLQAAIADHERTDFCSNFENGISPNTTVINLEVERHG